MTTQLTVRDVDDELVQGLGRRAAMNGRSVQEEHREILQAGLRGDVERASFKEAMTSMPDVATDQDFASVRDAPGTSPRPGRYG